MNIFKYKIALAGVAAIALASAPFGSAHATGNLFSVGGAVENPWYIGGAVGVSELEPRVLVDGGSVTDSSDNGIQFYGGYKLNHRFAIEAFYADSGKAQADIVTQSVEVDYRAFGLGIVGSQPLTHKVNVFAKLGFAKTENSLSSDLSNVSFRQLNQNTVYKGLGAEYKVNQKASIRLGYDYYDKDYQFLSLGFQANF